MKMTEVAFQADCTDSNGYCSSCDEVTNWGGVEPDARKYQCEVCEKMTVYGMEESILMGFITFVGEKEEANGTVTIRERGVKENKEMSLSYSSVYFREKVLQSKGKSLNY